MRRELKLPRHYVQEDDTFQLDAVVSLFAVVLLLLLTTAAAINGGETWLEYETQDEEKPAFRLESLDAPFKRHETWLLRDDELLHLDYDEVARILVGEETGGNRYAEDDITRTLLTFEIGAGGAGSYERMEITLAPEAIEDPGGVVTEVIDPNDAAAVEQWGARRAAANLIVWRSGIAHLPTLLHSAHAAGRPLTFTPRPGNGKFVSRKTAESFSFKGVLRAY